MFNQLVDPQSIKQDVDPLFRIENPPPGNTSNDERKRVGKQEDVSEKSVADQFSVEKQGKEKAEPERETQKQSGKNEHVSQVGMPARHAEHLLIGKAQRLANAHIYLEGAPI